MDTDLIIAEFVARNGPIVLSLPSAGMLRHQKSRMLAEGPETDGRTTLWLEDVPAERALVAAVIQSGEVCGLSFRAGDKKVISSVRLLRQDPALQVAADLIVPAVLVVRPEHVKTVQRRNCYRVAVPEDSDLRVRIWRIAEKADLQDVPMAATELNVILRNISTGGLGVVFIPEKEGPKSRVLNNERARIELTIAGSTLRIEGRLRYFGAPATRVGIPVGVAFKGLEAGVPGRQLLASLGKIVGELQREEVRRLKRGA